MKATTRSDPPQPVQPKRPSGQTRVDPPAARAAEQGHREAASPAEIEFKLTVPEARAAALAAALDALGPVKTSLLHAHYFDTPDDRLARAGMSLRLRQQDGRWLQTLKAGRPEDGSSLGAVRRDEHELEVEAPGDGKPVTIDLTRHRGTAAAAAAERLLADAAADEGGAVAAALIKRYSARIVRRSLQVNCRGSRIELALDQGHAEAGSHSLPICELELELKSGQVAALAKLARRWQRRHGLWLEAETKAERGRRLACGEAAPAVGRAQPVRLPAKLSADRFARSAVAGCLAHALPNAAAVAAGSVDPDHVHQLRVALRRLRTALRELDGFSTDLPTHIEPPLARAFAQLGTHRDRQSVLEAIKPKLLAAGARSVDWMAPQGTPIELPAVVRDPAFQRALIDAASFALSPANDAARKAGALRRRLREPLRRLHRQVARGGHDFLKLKEDDQHAVRKRLKRLRYLSEFAAPLFTQHHVDRYLGELRPAQDALGEYNDALVAKQLAREAAELPAAGDAGADFAVRWLADARPVVERRARKALRKVDDATRFWRQR